MKIIQVIGREIFDSRGLPTIECELTLEGGKRVFSSVPTGKSTSSHGMVELRDRDRLMGRGVIGSVKVIEESIAPLLIGRTPNQIEMDIAMLEADGTDNKSRFGSNTILAVSMAICRAQAFTERISIYDLIAYLSDYKSVSIPIPLFNVINGGVHAETNFPIQELLIVPVALESLTSVLEAAVMIFHQIKNLLREKGMPMGLGDEGGYAVEFSSVNVACDLVLEAIDSVDDSFVLGIDVAASQLYNASTGSYRWAGNNYSREELLGIYAKLVKEYPMFLIEDGLMDGDWNGWRSMTQLLGKDLQIVGDDIFATNPARIAAGIEDKIANSVVIKPSQIGTVTETLQAMQVAKDGGWQLIASHRSGETEDTFIVDLAVGASTQYLKVGGCRGGERLSKYNRLLRIEDYLQRSLLEEE